MELHDLTSSVMLLLRRPLEENVVNELDQIDYQGLLVFDTTQLELGDPRRLFRWMLDQTQAGAKTIFLRVLTRILERLGTFVDDTLLTAYREYVARQDESTLAEMAEISGSASPTVRSLGTTVEGAAREFVKFSRNPNLHTGVRQAFERFVGWYVRNRCKWNAERGQNVSQVRAQIIDHLSAAVDIFSRAYVFEAADVVGYLPHIAVGGEPTLWAQTYH
jgi:hypothetical protein